MWSQRYKGIKLFAEYVKGQARALVEQNVFIERLRSSNFRIRHSFRCRAEQYLKSNPACHSLTWQYAWKSFVSRKQLTLGLAACAFKWQGNDVSDDEIQEQVDELRNIQEIIRKQREDYSSHMPSHWEEVVAEEQIKMWKYPKDDDSGLMEYKVYGTFSDIPARLFFNIQLDSEYRKHWDDLVLKLNVIDENRAKNEQVMQWVSRLPYPFSHREYIFVRRAVINEKEKLMIISSKAVEHPSCPVNSNYVRVTCYTSHMVIRPHKSFDELGFDYMMTYCDDPQIVLPSSLSSWVVSQGIPEYIKKVHDACLLFGSPSGRSGRSNLPSYSV